MANNLKQRYHYDKEADALYIYIAPGKEDDHEEIAPGINLEFDSKERLIGIEILGVSRFANRRIPATRISREKIAA